MAKTATRGPTRWWNGVPSTTEAHGREIENNVNNFYTEAQMNALPLNDVEAEHRKITNSLVWLEAEIERWKTYREQVEGAFVARMNLEIIEPANARLHAMRIKGEVVIK